jgi:hypothetical protein
MIVTFVYINLGEVTDERAENCSHG